LSVDGASREGARKASRQLAARVALFLSTFILFSGVIGARIVDRGLVDRYGFQVYGGAGKSLLFGFICLAILVYHRGLSAQMRRWRLANFFWVLALLVMALAWYSANRLASGVAGAGWPVLCHVGLLGSVALLAIATFGPSNLLLLARRYRREILVSIVLAGAFYVFLAVVYRLWGPLASIVLDSVSFLLRLSGINAAVAPHRTLLLDRFGVTIAKYCSGIESIALFTALYALIGVLDWRRFNRGKLIGLFLPALAVLFVFNILRVYGLILGGYYINPRIALSLFHTYAGMLFFILYSLLFWKVSYGWLLKAQGD
jgi:exosortase/archaeosortase family protein